METTVQSLKGTRDFYPEEMEVRSWLYSTIRKVSEMYGYQEYDGPFLESIDLYAAKSGEELVKEQSFVFPDRSGDLITLRPELTPTLARMVAARQPALAYPLRWWSWGPFWRYERPQKGRGREFFQWNIDLIGVDNPEADAEIATIGAAFFREVGLTPDEVQILVNDRRLIDRNLSRLDIPLEQRPEVLRLIDRRDKMSEVEWRAYADEIGLSEAQFHGLVDLLAQRDLWKESDEMQRFFKAVKALGSEEYIQYAPHIIRGLEYYTGLVFEAWDREGEFRAILGGGRYDNLVGDVGGEPLPGTGLALGEMVTILVLEKFRRLPKDVGKSPAPVMITVFDEEHMEASLALSEMLRQAGLRVAVYPEPARLGKQFRYADRMGMKVAVVLGPEEVQAGQVAVKDLRSGEQVSVSSEDAAKTIGEVLARKGAS